MQPSGPSWTHPWQYRPIGCRRRTTAVAVPPHGLFCSGLASVLYAKGIARTNAFAANLVCMSEVVLAPCWSALFFGEVFRWNEFLGAAIIVLVIVANLASDAFGDGFLVALVRHRNKERA